MFSEIASFQAEWFEINGNNTLPGCNIKGSPELGAGKAIIIICLASFNPHNGAKRQNYGWAHFSDWETETFLEQTAELRGNSGTTSLLPSGP